MPASDLRAPSLLVLADGVLVRGAFSASVSNTNHYGADRFRLTAATSADPALGPLFWADATDTEVEIAVTVDGVSASLISGVVDTVVLDPVQGVVRIEGRDRTAALIEARTQEAFANRTSSEIATILAGRHGLSADVFPTTTPVGRYWQLEHDQITLDQFSRATTEWDLLVNLASHERFDVWVSGTTLHFRPTPDSSVVAAVFRPRPSAAGPATVSDMRLERALTLARDMEVVVKSWSSREGQAFEQRARAHRAGRRSASVQRYHYVVPDLTPDEALKLAQRKLAELTRHERVVTVEMPGDVTLSARALVRVEETGGSFDQDYFVDTIERTFDPREGFRQSVRARNVSPGAEIQ